MRVRVTYGDPAPQPQPLRAAPWGWFHAPHPHPDVMEIHLMPASDVGTHAFDTDCRCGCHEDPQSLGFFVHYAFDGREAYESGARKYH